MAGKIEKNHAVCQRFVAIAEFRGGLSGSTLSLALVFYAGILINERFG